MSQSLQLVSADQHDDPASSQGARLIELFRRLEQHCSFNKGDLVVWKTGLKNKRTPEYGEPAIVTCVLPMPIHDPSENESASPYFHEPLSLVIGVLREDDLLEFHVDARRFELFRTALLA